VKDPFIIVVIPRTMFHYLSGELQHKHLPSKFKSYFLLDVSRSTTAQDCIGRGKQSVLKRFIIK